MTRRLLTLISLAVAVVLSVSLVTAPVKGEAPGMATTNIQWTAEAGDRADVSAPAGPRRPLRVGDGLVRLRIQSDRSRISVTIEIELPRFFVRR